MNFSSDYKPFFKPFFLAKYLEAEDKLNPAFIKSDSSFKSELLKFKVSIFKIPFITIVPPTISYLQN